MWLLNFSHGLLVIVKHNIIIIIIIIIIINIINIIVMVLARLATVYPASMHKPGHSLYYGIGRASRGFPGFLSLGQPSLWLG